MPFPFTAYIENLRSNFKPSSITHFYFSPQRDGYFQVKKEKKKLKSKKAEKRPKRQNVTKQELQTGETFDSDLLHFFTLAICVRIPSCLGTSWMWLCEICYRDFWDICYSF